MTRQTIGSDQRGATVVELAFALPVFVMLIMGAFHFGHQIYINAVMQGALEEASRQVSLETANGQFGEIEKRYKSQIQPIMPQATISLTAQNYKDYDSVDQPEVWADGNSDGRCNNNEAFEDLNRNGRWDADAGATGIGGARDIVELTANVSYEALFPFYRFIGGSSIVNLSSKTYLKTQPYKQQQARQPVTGVCP